MSQSPEQIIEHWIANSVQYDFDDETGALRVSGSKGAGRRIIRALEHEGWQLIHRDTFKGVETR